MATSKSALKRIRTSEKARIRNKSCKTLLNTIEKKFRKAIESSDTASAAEILKSLHSRLDKASKAGVIHKNQAGRKKSRLAKVLTAAQAGTKE